MSNFWDPVTGWVYGAGKAITQPVVTPIVQAIEGSHLITPTLQPQPPQQPQPIPTPIQSGITYVSQSAPVKFVSGAADVGFGVLARGAGNVVGQGSVNAAFPTQMKRYDAAVAPLTPMVQKAMPLNQEQYALYRETMHSKWQSTNPSDIMSVAAFEVGDVVYKNPMAPAEWAATGLELWIGSELVGIGLSGVAARGGFGSKAAASTLKVMNNPWTSRALVAGSYGVSTYYETEGFTHGWGGNVAGGAKVASEFGYMYSPIVAMKAIPYAVKGINTAYTGAKTINSAYRVVTGKTGAGNQARAVGKIGTAFTRQGVPVYNIDEFMMVSQPGQLSYRPGVRQIGTKGTGTNWGKVWNGQKWVIETTPDVKMPELWGKQTTVTIPRPKSAYPSYATETVTKTKQPSDMLVVLMPRVKWDLKTTTVKPNEVTKQLTMLVANPPPGRSPSSPPTPRIPVVWLRPPIIPPTERRPPIPPPIMPPFVFPPAKPFRLPPIGLPGGVGGSSGGGINRRMKEAWKHRNKVAAELPAFFYNINLKKGNKKGFAKLFR